MQEISLKKMTCFWTKSIWLNAFLCVFFGLAIADENSLGIAFLGMFTGVLVFIAIYTFIEYKLIKNKRYDWQDNLRKSVLIKASSQLLIFFHFSIEAFCGYLALISVEILFGYKLNAFLFNLFATLITGTLLSAIVACIAIFRSFFNN